MSVPKHETSPRLHIDADKQRAYGSALMTGFVWVVEKQHNLTNAQAELKRISKRLKSPTEPITEDLVNAWQHQNSQVVNYWRSKVERYTAGVEPYVGRGVGISIFTADESLVTEGILRSVDYKKATFRIVKPDGDLKSVEFAKRRPLPPDVGSGHNYDPGYEATAIVAVQSLPESLRWAFKSDYLPSFPSGIDIYRDSHAAAAQLDV